MGFSVSTIAVRGKDIPAIHREFGVMATGRSIPEPPEEPVMGAMLPTGWYLLYIYDRTPTSTAVLARLSSGAKLVLCEVEEHVMASNASGWTDGREKWSVAHDAQRGPLHLETTGTPPAEFQTIADRLLERQRTLDDADHVFDIPVELALALTGFRYDGNPNGYPVSEFEVLMRTGERAPWWKIW